MLETIIKVLTTGKLIVNSVKFLSNLLESKKEKRINRLKEMIKVQCTDGTWNYSPKSFGMANGMIYALSVLEDKDPVYLKAPGIFLCELEND